MALRFSKQFTLTIISFLFVNLIYAQTFSYPTINPSGVNIQDFIPLGWKLKDSAKGDLNGDNLNDLALVIEYKDTLVEKRNGTINKGSPRILIVTFKNNKTGLYEVVEQNRIFILRYGEGGMDPEPYEGISIKNRVLQVDFQFVRSHASYKFRFQQSAIFLIGSSIAGSSGGKFESYDINFLTRKIKYEYALEGSDKSNIKWMRFNLKGLRRLSGMGHALSWEILPDVYI